MDAWFDMHAVCTHDMELALFLTRETEESRENVSIQKKRESKRQHSAGRDYCKYQKVFSDTIL